ncbi:MAG: tetratricopeptide repeat protein, partial [Cyanobacteria bacterium P01_H01_bin.35]
MNEQRLTAYAQLIQQLLECPQGQESDILQKHQHLIDEGLIVVMQQYAQHLAAADQKNKAQWLLNMAERLAQLLNQSQNSVSEESYNTLLQQLIISEYEDWGNSTPIYHILDNNRHLLDENLARILPQYASDLINKLPEDTDIIIALIANLSIHISNFPRGDRKAQIEIAIAGYLFTLSHCQENTEKWATTQHNLGSAYLYRIRDDRAQNLESAITAYHLALLVHTKEDFPYEWATTQNNLAAAYNDRIKGNRAENLENAIAASNLALSVYTPEDFPYYWAMTQNNLGNAYGDRIKGDRAENLENAIAAYRLALSVRKKEDFPIKWAMTQNNLATVYNDRIKGDRAENLESAIAAYHLALLVHTKEDFPYEWARTQNNLAAAYNDRIRGDKAENLENAIAASNLALSVRTKEDFPVEWARTQNNLAAAYNDRIRGDKAENLENAIAASNLALSV